MTARRRMHRFGAGAVATFMVVATGGVASASSQDDLAVAMAGVERGLEAARHQSSAGITDPRLAEAVAVVELLVAERLRTGPDLDVGDVLTQLVEEVPESLDGDLGSLLDDVKATGQELAEEKRSAAPGQTGTAGNAGGTGNGGENGNAGGNGGDNGNAGGGGSGGESGNAGGNGNGGASGNAGGNGGENGNAGGNGGENGNAGGNGGENGNAGGNGGENGNAGGNGGENGNAGGNGNGGDNGNAGGNGNGNGPPGG